MDKKNKKVVVSKGNNNQGFVSKGKGNKNCYGKPFFKKELCRSLKELVKGLSEISKISNLFK